MKSGFFDNTEVVSEDFATFVRGILTNGVTGDNEDVLKVTAAGGMKISVAPGYSWINGHFGVAEVAETLTISTADGAYPRIDRVVVRLDMSGNTVSLHVITGEAAETPLAPSLTRDGTVHELCLAEISLPAGATSITDDNILDTRSDKDLCGAVLANTKETLSLDGKADELEFQALSKKTTEIETEVDELKDGLAAKVIKGQTIVETLTKDSPLTLNADITGYCPIRLSVQVSVNLAAEDAGTGFEGYTGTASADILLFGEEERSVVVPFTFSGDGSHYSLSVTINVAAETEKTVVTSVLPEAPSGLVFRWNRITASMRGAYLP